MWRTMLFGLSLLASLAYGSGRCNVGTIAGGVRCGCPDVLSQINDGVVTCPSGYMPVVYDLGQPFPADSTTSSFTMEGSVRSMCEGVEKKVGVNGHLVICWGPPDRGCRQMVVPYNSFCIDTEDTQLGCQGACSSVSTHIIALMNAGAAHFHVCPPSANPSVPCRSTSNGGTELFRFQPGGFCVTDQCEGASTTNACVGGWGATYLGFGHHGTQQGWYDWASGAFRVDYRGRRPVCGALGDCLGNRGHWTGTFIATPSASSPNPPPCLTHAGDTCNPSACLP